ncbi:ELWxxDGT repeat protein [Reichenbachiella sp.]|uniref:ELWxxDGT repeat protein n=1 Tax=Reichenbachiella sp. TaxID=2184521 RepID=UPI003B5A7469
MKKAQVFSATAAIINLRKVDKHKPFSNRALKVIMGLLILYFHTPFLASAQLSLLKDINQTPNTTPYSIADISSSPMKFFESGGWIYFTAIGSEGRELWKTDKTPNGTVLVKDINPGPAPSDPKGFFEFGGEVYFLANDGIYGVELWKMDGTTDGTTLVKDINPGIANGPVYCDYCGDAKSFIEMNGKFYFTANNGAQGNELWESDGTESGTQLVKDINPGSNSASPSQFVFYDNKIFFTVYLPSTGNELWYSDGTAAGTHMLMEMVPGSSGGNPNHLTVVNGQLIFTASDSSNDYELYKTDGTPEGTELILNINPSTSSSPNFFTPMNDVLYFYANDGTHGNELWKSDGTTAGTVLVKDVEPEANSSYPDKFVVSNGTLYMRIHTSAHGSELWKSDGTEAGTVLVKDIVAGPGTSNVQQVAAADGIVYFSASVSGAGIELWKSDGTEGGTVQVKDINPGNDNSYPSSFLASGSSVVFSAQVDDSGYELWISDGTEGGTQIIKDILEPSEGSLTGFHKRVGSNVIFTADDGVNGNELWITDGTTIGTTMIKDISPGASSSSFNQFTEFNGLLYFHCNNDLWRSDGTESGTYELINGGIGYSMAGASGSIFFARYDPTNGNELWKSDGTIPGTVKVKDIDATGTNSSPNNLTNVNGTLFFTDNDGVNGTELWKSDGTEEGTQLVKNINPSTGSVYSFRLFSAIGNTLFFYADDGVNGTELWKSDGTDAGTVLVKDIYPGSSGSFFSHRHAVKDGKLYFGANSPGKGQELWVTDGTSDGTALVKDIVPGGTASGPDLYMELGGQLYFVINKPNGQNYLWTTDGTTDGTVEITHLGVRYMQSLIVGNNVAYFVGEPNFAWRTWRTDGTVAGTFGVSDDEAYTMDIISGDEALINVVNKTKGRELYKYTPEPKIPEITILRTYDELQTSDSYDYGTVETLSNEGGVGFAIKNSGNANLLISDISISGTHAADFTLNQSQTADKIHPGAATTFSISFSPQALGARNAKVTILSDDDDEATFEIDLFGEGIPQSQIITFLPLDEKNYGDANFNLTATASSNLAVTYVSSNEAVATVVNQTVTIVGVGETNITASQIGGGIYSAADDVIQKLTVNKRDLMAKANSTSKIYGEANPTFTISYTSFVNDDDAASIAVPPLISTSADELSSVGEYDINLSGGSDENYNIILEETKGILTIDKKELHVKGQDASRIYGEDDPEFELAYTGYINDDDEDDLEELPVAYTLTDATTSVGDYDILISGGLDNNYTIVQDINTGTLSIEQASQEIMFAELPTKYLSDPDFNLTATSTSSLNVTYNSSNLAVATITNGVVHLVGPGITTITASQAGNQNFSAATDVMQQLSVSVLQTITFNELESVTFGKEPFSLEANATSSLEVVFTSEDPTVASISGKTVTIVGAGTTTITASQPGNEDYEPAAAVARQLTVKKAEQTITFDQTSDQLEGGSDFNLSGSSTSNLTLAFSSPSDKITIDGDIVTILAPGRLTITASQPGSNNYLAAEPVEQSICINPLAPTISTDLSDITAPVLTSSATSGNQWYFNSEPISGATSSSLIVDARGVFQVLYAVDDCMSELSEAKSFIVTETPPNKPMQKEVQLFPNPVDEVLSIALNGFDTSSEVQINILDGTGKLRQAIRSNGGLVLSLTIHDFAPGLYMVQMSQGQHFQQVKFLKK